MKLIIKNFAKIEYAEIEFKKLTIFVGKNSTNKSYVAHLFYKGFNKSLHNLIKSIIELIFSKKERKIILKDALEYKFTQEDFKKLFNTKNIFNNKTEVYFIEEDKNIEEKIFILSKALLKSEDVKKHLDMKEKENKKELFEKLIFREILENSLFIPFYRLAYPLLYFPSSRSGFVLGFNNFIEGIISSYQSTSEFLTEPVIDFLKQFYKASLINQEIEDKNIEKLEEFLNEKLIKGKIIEKRRKLGLSKEYLFKPKGSRIKLKPHVISSATLEVLPFIAIIRSLKNCDASFIIEEPEAHLHPEAQINMARFLSLLANNSQNVVITTHSDYIVEEISNCIRLYTLKERDKKSFRKFLREEKLNKYPDIAISHEDVAFYLFKEENNKVVIKPLEVSEYGLEDENSTQVLDELINRAVKLGDLING